MRYGLACLMGMIAMVQAHAQGAAKAVDFPRAPLLSNTSTWAIRFPISSTP
jgi:hypothetical protein